jgi:hypothetical protein
MPSRHEHGVVEEVDGSLWEGANAVAMGRASSGKGKCDRLFPADLCPLNFPLTCSALVRIDTRTLVVPKNG